MTELKYIHIKDQDGYLRKWLIESNDRISYQIFYMGYTTSIRKDEVYIDGGKLVSDEVINTKYNDMKGVAFTTFGYVTLES